MGRDTFLYVALDYDSQQKNLELARLLADNNTSENYGFKINLDSIADFSQDALSPRIFVKQVMGKHNYKRKVFVDMKMWNGGRTMENIAKGCADAGVDIVNMYPHAQGKFIRRVAKALENTPTQLFTLTVLTHYTEDDTQELYGLSLHDAVQKLANIGYENGAKGLIVPGTQLKAVEDIPISKLCPAIRPASYENKKDNSQEQPVTPREAIDGGAKYLVVGSPIWKANNPVLALNSLLEEMV